MIKNRKSLTISCHRCSISYLCLPRELNNNSISALDDIIINQKLVMKGQHLFYENDPMDNLMVVFTGSVKDYWVDEEGNERIDNFYLRGDIIGLESMSFKKHMYSAVALEDVQLCLVPIPDLLTLMQKDESILTRVLNIKSYKMQNDKYIGLTTNAGERVVNFLLNFIYRLQERKQYIDCISLPMSQVEVSAYLGMAHETVNRILRNLSKDKIIRLKNKMIHIDDFEGLKKRGTSFQRFGQG